MTSKPPPKSPSGRIKLLVGSLVALAMAAAIVLYMTRAFTPKVQPGVSQPPSRPVPAEAPTGQLEWATRKRDVAVVGTVRSRSRAAIASKVLARVTHVHVRAGDKVKAGQLLVELDRRELAAQTSSASAAHRAAQADLRLAETEYRRTRQLLASGVATRRDFDLAKARREAAQARVRQARGGVRASASTLDYTRLTAPADGTIIERLAEPGDMASPGQAILTMYDPGGLRLEAHVRESLLPYVTIGTPLRVQVEAASFETQGAVEEIVPQAAAATRSFVVKIGIAKPKGLYPGMFGRAFVPAGDERLLLMPARARRRLGQVEFAEVITPGGLMRRQITTGRLFGDQLEVLTGLAPPGSEPTLLLLR